MEAVHTLIAYLGLTALTGFGVGLGIFLASHVVTPVKKISIKQTYDNLDK